MLLDCFFGDDEDDDLPYVEPRINVLLKELEQKDPLTHEIIVLLRKEINSELSAMSWRSIGGESH